RIALTRYLSTRREFFCSQKVTVTLKSNV
ncbi:hypothetical protein pipiens_000131, partial [Culex pipiens pipiens]